MANSTNARRRFFVPEVVQSSAMDCGPASLKCLLEGFGISVSYNRLREACQTDVDGTSIDTMEEVAIQLGLEAEQVMVPVDHLLLPEARALPAIVVVRLPSGLTHFEVIWRRHGNFVQVMDPAIGRRWTSCKQLLDEIYHHTITLPAAGWREWADSDEFLGPLRRRLGNLGLSRSSIERLIDTALADEGWRLPAALDASTRMVDSIVRSGGLGRGRQAARLLKAFFEREQQRDRLGEQTIPAAYWSVQPAPPGPDGEEQILLRGAVLVRALGRRHRTLTTGEGGEAEGEPAPLSPELVAALEEPPSRPGRKILQMLRADGLLAPTALLMALGLAMGGVIVEALLLRGLFDLGRELGLVEQRLGAIAALSLFVAMLLLLDLPIAAGVLRLGRHLEARLRVAFLEKIPLLGDRYFQSRLTSDMAERSHNVHTLRLLPDLGERLTRATFELALTTIGIIWLDPASAPIAILLAAIVVGLPLMAQPLLVERDLRVRSHAGALSRFYLDALLGLVAVRTHGAERAVRREHESLLVEWARASLGLQRAVVVVEAIQSLLGFGLAGWLLLGSLMQRSEASGILLLIYWALNLPVLGQEIALLARQYPTYRNVTLRLLEPLGALEEAEFQGAGQVALTLSADALAQPPGGVSLDRKFANPVGAIKKVGLQETMPMLLDRLELAVEAESHAEPQMGVAVTLEGVSVRVAGHMILEEINLSIEAGSHVAIVGHSGAGKSSLVGLLLGWYRPATGRFLVDGLPLDGGRLEQLRRQTAWVDPAVQLWNRSFLENLRYGLPPDASLPIGQVIEEADLHSLLQKLPNGLQTTLGEGGALVSGGEGQRVRLGRAILRSGARLVILDEPFRGLDRERRRELLARVRRLWRSATVLCITHDVGETRAFERVLVVEGGRIVEDGSPTGLAERSDSRYRALLESETAVREGLWLSGTWRRLRLDGGRLVEGKLVEENRKEEI